MIINYLILAHKSPSFLARIIKRLDNDSAFFFIHVDADTDIGIFKLIITPKKNVYFLDGKERKSIKWASYSIVEATLELMKKATENKTDGFCVLLSGEDYPLKNQKQLSDFFIQNYDTIFMHGFSIPSKNDWGSTGGLNRLNQYHFFLDKRGIKKSMYDIFSKHFWEKSKLWDIFDIIKLGRGQELKNLLFKRAFPKYLQPYGGSQWWSMPTLYVSEILNFLKLHPDYEKYHQYSLCPDEIFFQSIIYNLYPEKINKKATTYVNWVKENVQLPVVFKSVDDLSELLSNDSLFARKFDEVESRDLLDLIDNKCK